MGDEDILLSNSLSSCRTTQRHILIILGFLVICAPVAAGPLRSDFNGDGFDDLAIGVPEENVGHQGLFKPSAGAVNVLYGSGSGLTAEGNQFWHQNRRGVKGRAQVQDGFGGMLPFGSTLP